MDNWNIINSAEINNGNVFVKDKLIHSLDNDFVSISKELYNIHCKPYIKFFKMDSLSKLGFINAELLLKDFNLEGIDMNEVDLLIGNSQATKATDFKYLETTKTQPSPAVFVYTLPNILMGEICIKHGFKGQNIFFISESFNENELYENALILLNNSTTQLLICGWVDYFDNNNFKSVLYLIGKDSKSSIFAFQNLKELNHFN